MGLFFRLDFSKNFETIFRFVFRRSIEFPFSWILLLFSFNFGASCSRVGKVFSDSFSALDETVKKEGEEKGGKGERGRRAREEGIKRKRNQERKKGRQKREKITIDRASVWYSAEEK